LFYVSSHFPSLSDINIESIENKLLQRLLAKAIQYSEWPQIFWGLPAQNLEKEFGGYTITPDPNERRGYYIRHQNRATCNLLHF
jgi:hypothetical protein